MTGNVAAAFFETVCDKAREAERTAGTVHERSYALAGLVLKLRFLGDALIEPVGRALAHLAISPAGSTADLVIDCWDCASLRLEPPHAPVAKDAFTPRGEIHGLNDARFHAAFAQGGRLLSLMDVATKRAVFCVGDAAAIERFEAAEPIRGLLAWLLRAHGRQVLHAGAVGHADGGVLLLGRSGAGKSNTALGCLVSNLRYASDDFCAISASGVPTVYSVYSTGKTREEDWARHPFFATLAADLDPTRRDKVIYYLNEAVPERLITQFPVRAILVLKRRGDACHARPIAAGTALALSAPDTAMLIPGSGPEVLRELGKLVRAVPCFEFELGPNPAAIPPAIEALLDALRPPAVRVG